MQTLIFKFTQYPVKIENSQKKGLNRRYTEQMYSKPEKKVYKNIPS